MEARGEVRVCERVGVCERMSVRTWVCARVCREAGR